MLHRNSQKRIYVQNAIYSITTCTFARYPYFTEDIFCKLFVQELELCQRVKGFELLGYKINWEHVHLLIQPSAEHDFSEIMHFLKRHYSRNHNYIVATNGAIQYSKASDNISKATLANVAFEHVLGINELDNYVNNHKKRFWEKYPHNAPRRQFRWQRSSHFHIIEDLVDLYDHVQYIENQWIHHGLSENKWCYIREDLQTIKGEFPEIRL